MGSSSIPWISENKIYISNKHGGIPLMPKRYTKLPTTISEACYFYIARSTQLRMWSHWYMDVYVWTCTCIWNLNPSTEVFLMAQRFASFHTVEFPFGDHGDPRAPERLCRCWGYFSKKLSTKLCRTCTGRSRL